MKPRTAAEKAKLLLHTASQRLHTADPVTELGDVLEDSMPLPVGDSAYRGHRMLEPNFSETSSNNLAFLMSTGGPFASAADRVETATQAMRRMVGRNFGREALRWFDGRSEPMRGRGHRASDSGAFFSTGFDRNGVTESLVSYEWGPSQMEALPAVLFRLAQTAVEALPGLRPAFTAIRCGRSSGSQQITFEVDSALPLNDLKPLMEQLGLGRQHASLMSASAFVLGARFTLPPGAAAITLQPYREGVEMRLDVNLDAIPDTPSQFMSLLRMQMAERPTSLRGLDHWITAMTPEGYHGPGNVSVLSIRVRPDMPARVALYLRPAPLETPAPSSNRVNGNAGKLVTVERAPSAASY